MKYSSELKRIFTDSRTWLVFFLGFCSGFPWSILGASITQFLIEAGISRSSIGLLSVAFLTYTVNFLWSPIVDKWNLFSLTKNKRSSWIITTMLIQAFVMVVFSFFITSNPIIIAIGISMFFIALASSTQDISIDAWRVEIMKTNEHSNISMSAAMATIGWFTGFNIPASLAFISVDKLGISWGECFFCFSVVYLVLAYIIFRLSRVNKFNSSIKIEQDSYAKKIKLATEKVFSIKKSFVELLITPFSYFFQRNGYFAILLLSFIVTFKLGESFLGHMSINFYNEIGFTKTDIAIYSKTIGWGATIIFSLSAGFIMVRFGLLKGLFISGVAMALTNLLYSAIAIVGPSTELFFWTILLDNFTSSVSSVAFVAFISNLCGRESVAVEYAFLASIGSFGRTFLSSFSGVLVDYLDGNWGLFFAITAIMTIPSLIMLFFIYKKTSTKLRN